MKKETSKTIFLWRNRSLKKVQALSTPLPSIRVNSNKVNLKGYKI